MSEEAAKINFSGKYKHVKSENFDEFLQANGAPWIARKMATSTNPDVEIIQDGDNFVLKVTSIIFTKESKFTIGQEFEEKQQNGVIMKVMPNWEGEKLVLNYTPKETGSDVKSQKTTRELKEDQLVMIMELGDIICTRTYQKVAAAK